MYTLLSQGQEAIFAAGEYRLRIRFITALVVRITFTQGRVFSERQSRMVVAQNEYVQFQLREEQDAFRLWTGAVTVILQKDGGALSFYDRAGALLMREPNRGGKWLTEKDVLRHVFSRDGEAAYAQSLDGARAVGRVVETVVDRRAFEAKLEFVFAENEAIFGFGSHEEGYGNLRGRSRELYQQNMKAVVPCFVSTLGYGVLFECGSLMTFHDDALGSYWWADTVEELDYYLFAGATYDEVMGGYRHLTGPVPMLPKWAFGYVQSKERYVTAEELVDIVREYRRRKVPLDCIVLDWKSWPNGSGWGQKSFDPTRFPDPSAMAAELHAMGARLMVSIWPIMTGGCADQRELLSAGYMLGNQATYNAFDPEARAVYWRQVRQGLFEHGVDAWWCDCTEPFEADWSGAVKPEPHARLLLNTTESKMYLDPAEINLYSLEHSRGMYEGQRASGSEKRVLNLTRSSYAGQHRYGTVTWNGDTCATWETLRRCIAEGVNFCATGEPYWTVDVGGFFIDHRPEYWFWRGEYGAGCRGLTDMNALAPDPCDLGCKDSGFHELYTRWMQYAVFLPMLRSHGTDAAREIWRFGEEGGAFYDAIANAIRLRYRLLPYIYSLAAEVTSRGSAMLRAVALEFPQDQATHDLLDEYMLGHAMLVCPVAQAMYFEAGSRPIEGVVRTREVYLPACAGWFDFADSKFHRGGVTIAADATLDRIPVFIRAGSILVLTEPMQFVDEVVDARFEVRVYMGDDARFRLYEDAGDGYGYEQGECAWVRFDWSEVDGVFQISPREGSFTGLVREREWLVVLIGAEAYEEHLVTYRGDGLRIVRGQR